ncbi:MAG: universal stress protein [Bacteroidetes bacterium]|nr:universal stress protein [Bacteroidota bacterium]
MIKKIICPTDFSKSANNASEYAAHLAKEIGADLLYVNVQQIIPVAAAVSLAEGIGADERENFKMAGKKLKEICKETTETFKIKTDFEVDISTQSMTKIISTFGAENTLIVMGTNGADDMYQYFFGTNTFHVISKTSLPVLVIPENAIYKSIKKIVFAWDYNTKNTFSFSLLNNFVKDFNPEFIFLHVSKHHTEISEDVFRSLRSEVTNVLGKINNVEFEQIFSDNIPGSINDYMKSSEANILSITFYNRGILRNMFHGTVAKELSETSHYPILVLHA